MPRFPLPRKLSTVRLDVGGSVFHTTLAALRNREGFFRVVFGGHIEIVRDSDGCVFIDRSPLVFQLVLNHLCDHPLHIPELSARETDALIIDSHFYELVELQHQLCAAVKPLILPEQRSLDGLSSFDELVEVLEFNLSVREQELARDEAALGRIIARANECMGGEKVKLQLQDRIVCATRNTLTSHDGPLKRKFGQPGQQWRTDVNEADGSVFIDSNWDTFQHVLNMLRGYPEPMGLSPGERESLEHGLEYFGGLTWRPKFHPSRLQRPLDQVGSSILNRFDSSGAGRDMLRQLQVWLEHYDLGERLYHCNGDEQSPDAFHKTCDGASQSLILCRSGNNVFGGFASVSWGRDEEDQTDIYKEGEECWLFTLTNPHNVPPTRFSCINTDYAIYCSNEFGPAFGLGRDLVFWYYDTESCYSNFPQSYEDTTGKGCSLFTGSRLFTYDELEVFDCH